MQEAWTCRLFVKAQSPHQLQQRNIGVPHEDSPRRAATKSWILDTPTSRLYGVSQGASRVQASVQHPKTISNSTRGHGLTEDQRTLEGHIGCLSLLPRALIFHKAQSTLAIGWGAFLSWNSVADSVPFSRLLFLIRPFFSFLLIDFLHSNWSRCDFRSPATSLSLTVRLRLAADASWLTTVNCKHAPFCPLMEPRSLKPIQRCCSSKSHCRGMTNRRIPVHPREHMA